MSKDINNLKELKNKIEFFDENIENGNKNEKIRLLLIEQEIFHILNLKNVDNLLLNLFGFFVL